MTNQFNRWPAVWSCLDEEQCEIIAAWYREMQEQEKKKHRAEIERIICSGFLAGVVPWAVMQAFECRHEGLLSVLLMGFGAALVAFLVYTFALALYRGSPNVEEKPLTAIEVTWKTAVIITAIWMLALLLTR